MDAFAPLQARFLRALRACLPWDWRTLSLTVEFDLDSLSETGRVSSWRKSAIPLAELSLDAEPSMVLFELQRAANRATLAGHAPLRTMRVEWKRGGDPQVDYGFLPARPTAVSELQRDDLGLLPMAPFLTRLPATMLAEMNDQDIVGALRTYVCAQDDPGRVAPQLLAIAHTIDWFATVSRSGIGGYLAMLEDEPLPVWSAALDAVDAQLSSLDDPRPLHDFRESLSVCAEDWEIAALACARAGLPGFEGSDEQRGQAQRRLERAVSEFEDVWYAELGRRVRAEPLRYAVD